MALLNNLTSRKKLFFWAILMVAQLAFIEATVRTFFAFRVGPRVFFFGTRFQTNKVETPVKHDVRPDNRAAAGYTKYFPHERKADHNPETRESFSIRINSRGFRGEEFTVEKPAGTIRVVTLGSSSTFGYYNRDHETYPYHLEENLNRQHPGRTFEVINLGIPHLRSENVLALFLAEALPLNPDVVTFYDGINDAGTREPIAGRSPASATPTISGVAHQSSLREKLASHAWLKGLYKRTRDASLSLAFLDSFLQDEPIRYGETDVQQYLTDRIRYFLENVSAIRDECMRRNITFIVASQQAQSLSFPNRRGMTYDEEAERIRKKLATAKQITFNDVAFLRHHAQTQAVRSWVASNNVRFVDVIAALDQDRDVLLTWVHLSPRGNRMVADALTPAIIAAVSAR